jgi:catechol 1,2-dioxygenase
MNISRRAILAGGAATSAAWALGLRAQDPSPLAPTEANIEGPYYRPNAPFRSALADGLKGEPLRIAGRVRDVDGSPLSGAVIDVWQADREGAYDLTSDAFRLRGRIRCDAEGRYAFTTLRPGQYDMGEAKRPSHIHYKISAEGRRTLTTQLYFKGDPWLARDPFFRPSLIIDVPKDAGAFDIVLAKGR